MKFAIVITCMGRLHHLKQSLPRFVRQDIEDYEVFVVDWSSPDRLQGWLKENDHPVAHRIDVPGKEYFHLAAARNVGGREACRLGAEYLVFIDVDILVPENFLSANLDTIEKAESQYGIDFFLQTREIENCGIKDRCIWGTCILPSKLWRANEYNENITSYGHDDTELYSYLMEQGARHLPLNVNGVTGIPHTDEDRARHYPLERALITEGKHTNLSLYRGEMGNLYEHGLTLIRHRDRPRAPDFLCIGAQKSATTWMHFTLTKHPGIWLAPHKAILHFGAPDPATRSQRREHRLRFFHRYLKEQLSKSEPDRFGLHWYGKLALEVPDDDAWYLSLFEHVPDEVVTGETSPAYALLTRDEVKKVRELAPEAKILFLMRDPLDRWWSHVRKLMRGVELKELTENDYLRTALRTNMCRHSNYRATIETWESVFPQNQILYLFHEEIADGAGLFFEKVCRFLGLPYSISFFPAYDKVHNLGPNLKPSPTLLRIMANEQLTHCEWLAQRFGGPPVKWLEKIREILDSDSSPDKVALGG